MKAVLAWLTLIVATLPVGCGYGSGSRGRGMYNGGIGAISSYPNLTGNFGFSAQSQVTAGATTSIGGALNTDGIGRITGTLHVEGSSCYLITDDVPIMGNVTLQGQLTLSSSMVKGQILTIMGSASPDGKSVTNATYTITGGCAAGEHGTVTGIVVQGFSGNYSGTLKSNSGSSVSVSGSLMQAGTPDVHGFYMLSGMLNFAGSSCFSSAMVQNSDVAGLTMVLQLKANDGSTIDFFGVATDGTTRMVNGAYTVTGGTCNGDKGQGMLMH